MNWVSIFLDILGLWVASEVIYFIIRLIKGIKD